MIDYIGDISKADAGALSRWAANANNILEFGCGASTQVLASYAKGSLISIDTDPNWIAKTQKNLDRLGGKYNVLFYDYNQFWEVSPEGPTYDFIFDDGADHLRRSFGMRIWPNLKIGGWLALHDQRRKPDWDNTMAIIDMYWLEIGTVHFNHAHSNITFIQKKVREPYSNWQIDENIDMSKW